LIEILTALDNDPSNSNAEASEYDPITPLLGSLHLNTQDLAENHDQYIGEALHILAELVALFYSPLRIPRPRLFEIIDSIKTASFVEVLPIEPEIDTLA
jgi:hypothetical protein